MKTAARIEKKISKLPPGQVVGYAEIGVSADEYQAAAKALSRLIASGTLKRASTGLFYKPQKTVFGELQPAEEELLRPYLFENGERVAYITGLSLYNKMGLTTQIPRVIRVASRKKRIVATAGNLKIQAVKSYAEVTDQNYRLLELLDALKDFKTIQDIDKTKGIKVLKSKIKQLANTAKLDMLDLALGYPPRVRALLGALLEAMKEKSSLFKQLKQSLNPLSSYEFGIDNKALPSISNWNIN